MPGMPPVTYAKDAAMKLLAGGVPSLAVEKSVRKAFVFWTTFENIPLPVPLRPALVLDFAETFMRHLEPWRGESRYNLTFNIANEVMLRALRAWWQEYKHLRELM